MNPRETVDDGIALDLPDKSQEEPTMTPSLAASLSRIDSWTPEVEELAASNMKRGKEILECQEKIRFYQSRLRKLRAEHRRAKMLTNLMHQAWNVWPSLSRKEKFRKDNLLAALQCSCLPQDLCEDSWNQVVPDRIKDDRDLFLARLNRADFHEYATSVLLVPKRLQQDKQVMLRVVSVYPEIMQQDGVVSNELLDDKEFLTALTQCNNSTLVISDADVCKFSERLRCDADCMFLCLKEIPGRPTYLSKSLRNDKEFALRVAQNGRDLFSDVTLRDFSHRLRNDVTVVTAFCQASGLNLIHASYHLRKNYNVISAACQNDPAAFLHAIKSRDKRMLMRSHEFVLELFRTCSDERAAERLWKQTAAVHWVGDWQICAAAALATDGATQREIVSLWNRDMVFMKTVIASQPWLWRELPIEWKHDDSELALLAVRSIASASDAVVLYAVLGGSRGLERYTAILQDRQVIMAIVQYASHEQLVELLGDFWEITPLADFEFCVELCRLNGRVYELLTPLQKEDRRILKAALEATPSVLMHVRPFVQHLYPDLVAKALRDASGVELEEIFLAIDEDLWLNREVALAWVSSGGGYLEGFFPDEFDEDAELFLAVAEYSPDDFYFASELLYSDKDYMMQVIKKNGALLDEVDFDLADDYDLMLAAFAQSRDIVPGFESEQDSFRRLTQFASKVRARLSGNVGFSTFLTGVCLSKVSSAANLNQGNETTLGFLQTIADYVGIPKGEELQQLRIVSANLARWGY